jgi:hypothetical protein
MSVVPSPNKDNNKMKPQQEKLQPTYMQEKNCDDILRFRQTCGLVSNII